MMKSEFEAIAGYEVSLEDYNNIIEPMYMASNLDKVEFVGTINKKRFALPTRKQIKNQMKKIAEHLQDTFTRYTDYESKERLQEIADDYAKRFFGKGFRAYIVEEMKWSCYYPSSVDIYDGNTGKTLETIAF